jgi:hypothetical protein
VKHLGHFAVRGTEESNLPRVPQPRLDWNTENGTELMFFTEVNVNILFFSLFMNKNTSLRKDRNFRNMVLIPT